jgi:3-phenylpropionate/cinnamic acid dioxygenase small subunit
MSDAAAISSELSDRLEIASLIARVALVADMGSLDDYKGLYTEGASWEFPSAPRRGLPDIMEGARERRAAGDTGPGSATRHAITTLSVSVLSEDEAEADSYFLFYTDTTTTPTLRLMGHYHDTLQREDGAWRIARRQITIG